MTIPDQIFAQALERHAHGESIQYIAADYPDYSHELLGLLSVSQTVMTIPKLVPPTPYKRQLFAEQLVTTSWFMQLLPFARVAVIPLSLVVALLGGWFGVNATENSLPGDKLYTIKRATEEARLTLTRDQEKIASLHVEFMQNRIADVQRAADSGNQESETAALEALKSQTEETFAVVAPVATANALAKQDSSLLNTLVAINNEQKDVLSALTETSETELAKNEATVALEDSKKNDEALAKIIASVNDQAMADLPNKISVMGEITLYANNKITVEKNTFIIDDSTVITSSDGAVLTDITILTGRVSVTGSRGDDAILIAKQITLLPAITEEGSVKGEVHIIPTKKPKATIPKTTPPAVETTDVPNNTNTAPQATGTYITEPSTPQYNP